VFIIAELFVDRTVLLPAMIYEIPGFIAIENKNTNNE
jgi:hypothetical protein